ncbi:reverse transcriptase domain-containing protein [Tanacetum coccineum]
MVIATRQTGTSQNTMNEELREMIGEMITASLSGIQASIVQLNQTMQSIVTSQEGILVQQNYHTTDINILKNEEGTSRPIQYTRMTKLEFPKFSGEDLKNLKRDGSMADYQDKFEVLLGKVELSDQYAISLFFGGLQTEIGLVVKMFKPKTLYDAYHLARMQEATKTAMAKRTQIALPLPASSANKVVGSTSDTPRRQLSRKEYEEKGAKNLCFYYDQKYAPGHKFTRQVFSIELLTKEECLGDEFDSDQDIVYNVEEDRIQLHISLNALAGITTFHTMRIKGRVGKVSIHILVDSGSTYNFMDVNCAKRIRCKIKKTYPLQVDVPGGNKMVSAFECKDFIWSLQGMEFKSDVVLLPLGGCEMVLGVQWLSTLGDIKWNFESMRMEFMYCGNKVILRGTKQATLQWMTGKECSRNMIMPPRIRTRSAGRPAAESLGGGMSERVSRGGTGRRPREGNDERVDELNGQGNGLGIGANGGVEVANGNVGGANGGAPEFPMIIAQQLQNLLPAMLAQVSNQGNVGNHNGNVFNKNVHGNIGNVIVNGNRVGCSYKEFLACNPMEYDGKGGVVALTRWIEKIESIRTLSQEVVVSMSWNDFKCMMIQEFCPSHEMQKLESELWNHAMVGVGHDAYTDRFHELARLVPHLVTPDSRMIESRGGRGRRPREGNDERVDELNGQGNDLGREANGGVDGANGNVSNQGNVGNQKGNVVNENVQGNVGNVIVNGNLVGCSYKEFLACNPKEYDGKGGVVALTRWIEKMEYVHDMSVCSIDQKVKYTAGLLWSKALTWWNSQIRTLSHEVVVSMSWNDFKCMMIQEFCPSHEMQKLESEFWNHAMVGAGHVAYTDRLCVGLALPQIWGIGLRHQDEEGLRMSGEMWGNLCKDRIEEGDNKRTRM